MLIFAHIFAGAASGLVLWWFLRDARIMLLCIAASQLSDVIDKPLGFIFLPQTLGPGRIYFHALLAVVVITALAFLVWRFRNSTIVFLVAGAVLLHQLLDAMWHEPVSWFYPVLGPFQPYRDPNYFGTYFWLEISSVSEWVFLFATLLVFSIVYVNRFTLPFPSWISRVRVPASFAVLMFLAVLGSYSVWSGSTGTGNLMAPYNAPEDNVIMGVMALAGFCILVASRHVTALAGELKK